MTRAPALWRTAAVAIAALLAADAGLAQTVMAAFGFSAATGLLTWASGALYARMGAGTFLVMAAVGGAAILLVPGLRRHAPPQA